MIVKLEELKPGKKYYYYYLDAQRRKPLPIQLSIRIGEIETRDLSSREQDFVFWRSYSRQTEDPRSIKYYISKATRNKSWKGRGCIIEPELKSFSNTSDYLSLFDQNREGLNFKNYVTFLQSNNSKYYKIFDTKQDAIREGIKDLDEAILKLERIVNQLSSEYYKLRDIISGTEFNNISNKWIDANQTNVSLNKGDKIWGYFFNINYSVWSSNEEVLWMVDIPPFELTFEGWNPESTKRDTRFFIAESKRSFRFMNLRGYSYYDDYLTLCGDKDDCMKVYLYKKNERINNILLRMTGDLSSIKREREKLISRLEKDLIL